MTASLDQEEIAWAAGFFDGDGCFSVSRVGRWAGAFVLGTDSENIFRFQSALRCGNVQEKSVLARPGAWSKKPQYAFRTYADVDAVVHSLFPLLGDVKREQAQRALEFLGRWNDENFSNPALLLFERRMQLAWAAGFFDAEGCFSFTPGSGICASITNTDLELLERFLDVVGFGKIYGPYRVKASDVYERQPHYFYRVSGLERVQALAALLWFKMSSAKKEQARMTLAHVSPTCRRGHPKKPGHAGCGQCMADYWRARREARRDGSTAEPATLYLTA